MKTLCFFVDYLKKGLFRMLSATFIFIIYIILRFIFEPPEQLEFQAFIDSYLVWKSLIVLIVIGFLSILLDLFNFYVPDSLSIKVDWYFGKHKWGKFSSYFSKVYMQRATRSSFFLRVDDLDEIIHRLYNSVTGEIFLFNPSPELLNSDEDKWKNIRKAIKQNEVNISKIIFSIPEITHFVSVSNIANKLQLPPDKIELKEILLQEFKELADQFRMGVYHQETGSDKKIEYFLYRPIKEPYQDKFVLIQDYNVLNKLIYPNTPDHRLHRGISDLINSIS